VVRSGCWWYGSKGWTFPTIFCYILLLCDRWQQRSNMTKWCLTWECIWSKGMSLNSSMQEKTALIDIHQHLLNVYEDQTLDVSTVRWWVVHFSSGDSDVKDKWWAFWISWTLDKPSTLTTISQCWLSWRLKLPQSGQRRQPCSCNTTTPRPHASLKTGAHCQSWLDCPTTFIVHSRFGVFWFPSVHNN